MDSGDERGVIDAFRETIVIGPQGPSSQQVAQQVLDEIEEACRERLGCDRPAGPHLERSADNIMVYSKSDAFEGQLQVQIANNMTYRDGRQQSFLAVSAKAELSSAQLAQAQSRANTTRFAGYIVGVTVGLGLVWAFNAWGQHMADSSATGTYEAMDISKFLWLLGCGGGLGIAHAVGTWLEERARYTTLANPEISGQLRRWQALLEALRAIKARKRPVVGMD
jgi:hypothetical protein